MKNSKRILIIIFVLQLIFPAILCIYGIDNEIHFDDRAQEIKVSISGIDYSNVMFFDEDCSENELHITLHDYDFYDTYDYNPGGYYVFEEKENGIYDLAFQKTIPTNTPLFISAKRGEYCIDFYREVKSENLSKFKKMIDDGNIDNISVYSYTPYTFDEYDSYVQITEPPTEAYAILKVYNGKYELKDIYLDGLQIEQYLENLSNGTEDRAADNATLEARYATVNAAWDSYDKDVEISEALEKVMEIIEEGNYDSDNYDQAVNEILKVTNN